MRRLLLLLTAWCVAACTADPAAAEPPVWRVRDADTEVTLFGGIHALSPWVHWRSPALEAALAQADVVVFEAAPAADPVAAAREWETAMASARLPTGLSLRARLGERAWARVERLAPEAGLTGTQLEPLEPWFAAVMLDGGWSARTDRRREAGVEAWARARVPASAEVLSLDEEGFSALGRLPQAAQAQLLARSLDDIERRADYLAADRHWATGDLSGVQAEVAGMAARQPELYEALILRRNAAWTERLVQLMNRPGRIVVIVGAGHVVGRDGLPARLRAAGLDVEGP